MSDTLRIDELIQRLENEQSPADMGLNQDEMRLLDIMALLRGEKNLQADPVFAAALRERLATEIGILSEDEKRAKNRKGKVFFTFALIALIGAGAFYFERSPSTSHPVATRKAKPDTPQTAVFGKLPFFAGQTIRPEQSSQANGLSPSISKNGSSTTSASAQGIGGSGSASTEWKYVWNAGDPSLPLTIKVFKNKPNAFDKSRAYSLAKKLGFEAAARSITVMYPGTPNENSSYLFVSGINESRTLTLSSGTFSYTAYNIKQSASANAQPVADDKAISAATSWLENAGLLPKNAAKGKVGSNPGALGVTSVEEPLISPAPSGSASGSGSIGTSKGSATAPSFDTWVSPSKFVFFSLPVSASGNGATTSVVCEGAAVVEVASDGTVASAHGLILQDYISSDYPLNLARVIFDKIAAGQGSNLVAPQTSTSASTAKTSIKPIFTVHSVELGYTQTTGANNSVFLEPVFLFKGSLDPIYGHLEDVTITAPAVKDDFVEQAVTQKNSVAPTPAASTSGTTAKR